MAGRDISASRRPERLAKESLRPYGGSQNTGDHTSAPPLPPLSAKQPGSIYRLPGGSGIAQGSLFAPLKKELLELLVSLAADLFDFEVDPWSTSLFGRLGDNCRYRFTSRDWFFCRIVFDIRAIESIEIRLWVQRRVSVHENTFQLRCASCQKQTSNLYFETFFHTVAMSAPRFSCRR
jgi:hypothetical protein